MGGRAADASAAFPNAPNRSRRVYVPAQQLNSAKVEQPPSPFGTQQRQDTGPGVFTQGASAVWARSPSNSRNAASPQQVASPFEPVPQPWPCSCGFRNRRTARQCQRRNPGPCLRPRPQPDANGFAQPVQTTLVPAQGNAARDLGRPPPHGFGHGLWMVDKLGQEVFIEGNNKARKAEMRKHNKALEDASAAASASGPTNGAATAADTTSADEIAELQTTIRCAKKNGLDVSVLESSLRALQRPTTAKPLTVGQAKQAAHTLEQQYRKRCGAVVAAKESLLLQEAELQELAVKFEEACVLRDVLIEQDFRATDIRL